MLTSGSVPSSATWSKPLTATITKVPPSSGATAHHLTRQQGALPCSGGSEGHGSGAHHKLAPEPVVRQRLIPGMTEAPVKVNSLAQQRALVAQMRADIKGQQGKGAVVGAAAAARPGAAASPAAPKATRELPSRGSTSGVGRQPATSLGPSRTGSQFEALFGADGGDEESSEPDGAFFSGAAASGEDESEEAGAAAEQPLEPFQHKDEDFPGLPSTAPSQQTGQSRFRQLQADRQAAEQAAAAAASRAAAQPADAVLPSPSPASPAPAPAPAGAEDYGGEATAEEEAAMETAAIAAAAPAPAFVIAGVDPTAFINLLMSVCPEVALEYYQIGNLVVAADPQAAAAVQYDSAGLLCNASFYYSSAGDDQLIYVGSGLDVDVLARMGFVDPASSEPPAAAPEPSPTPPLESGTQTPEPVSPSPAAPQHPPPQFGVGALAAAQQQQPTQYGQFQLPAPFPEPAPLPVVQQQHHQHHATPVPVVEEEDDPEDLEDLLALCMGGGGGSTPPAPAPAAPAKAPAPVPTINYAQAQAQVSYAGGFGMLQQGVPAYGAAAPTWQPPGAAYWQPPAQGVYGAAAQQQQPQHSEEPLSHLLGLLQVGSS